MDLHLPQGAAGCFLDRNAFRPLPQRDQRFSKPIEERPQVAASSRADSRQQCVQALVLEMELAKRSAKITQCSERYRERTRYSVGSRRPPRSKSIGNRRQLLQARLLRPTSAQSNVAGIGTRISDRVRPGGTLPPAYEACEPQPDHVSAAKGDRRWNKLADKAQSSSVDLN